MIDVKEKQKNIEEKLLKSSRKIKVKNSQVSAVEVDKMNKTTVSMFRSEAENSDLLDDDEAEPEYIVIGCKLPNGVVIRVGENNYLLRCTNDMPGNGGIRHYGGIGFTKMDKKIWQQFLNTHEQWTPISNGSVFISHNQDYWWEV